jgi:adenylyl-sulfate kinase
MVSDHISWHEGAVGYGERCRLLGQRGAVLWLTGLSGSGKSTVAVEAEKRLTARGRLCYRLDGDNIRCGLNADLGFSPEDRRENIRRVAHVASLMRDVGVIVLVSFITPYQSLRDMAREIIGEEHFHEIYVKAELATCMRRDPKGLYKKAQSGEIGDFTGVSAPFEEPPNPALTLDTDRYDLDECCDRLIAYLAAHHIVDSF